MFLAAFSIGLLILNIYCFIRKKYLYLFIPCLLLLPNYYGIVISDALPVITVTRMMFLVFFVYSYINRRREFCFRDISFSRLPKRYYLLMMYFSLRILSNLRYVTTYSQAIKTILVIIIEQLFLLLAVYLLQPTKSEQFTLIKTIVWSSAILSLSGIAESITYIRIFDNLYTISRTMLNERYIRLGLLRATTTFGLPSLFGNACLLVFPLVLYLYEETRHKIYLLCSLIFIFAIIHSGCRSDMLFLIFTLGIYAIKHIKDRKRFWLFAKNIMIITVATGMIIGVLSFTSPLLAYYYSGTAKSVLNSIGFNLPIDDNASSAGTPGFGENPDGTKSRIMLLSGLNYTAKNKPIFGFGSRAQERGDIQYYWNNNWIVINTYDLGVVEIFCDEGLVGLLGVIMLISFLLLSSIKSGCYVYTLCIIVFVISTLSSICMFTFLLVYYIVFNNWSHESQPPAL